MEQTPGRTVDLALSSDTFAIKLKTHLFSCEHHWRLLVIRRYTHGQMNWLIDWCWFAVRVVQMMWSQSSSPEPRRSNRGRREHTPCRNRSSVSCVLILRSKSHLHLASQTRGPQCFTCTCKKHVRKVLLDPEGARLLTYSSMSLR